MPLIPLNGMKAMATQNIAAVPNKTYIQIHFRNVQSLCNIDNGNLSVKRTILANPPMDGSDRTYSLIRILDDRVKPSRKNRKIKKLIRKRILYIMINVRSISMQWKMSCWLIVKGI